MIGPETLAYARQLAWTLDQAGRCLADLTDELASWRPPLPEGNSPAAIVTHLLSTTRVYALGFGCGLPVERERSTEFAPGRAAVTMLRHQLSLLSAEIERAVPAAPAASLDQPLLPPQHLWGTGIPHEITPRDALLESIRHAAIHLGELRLMRDWAKWAGGEAGRQGDRA